VLCGRCTMNLSSSRSGLEMGVGAAIDEVSSTVLGQTLGRNAEGQETSGFTRYADPESADCVRIDARVSCLRRA
jgi:hypothetical protein